MYVYIYITYILKHDLHAHLLLSLHAFDAVIQISAFHIVGDTTGEAFEDPSVDRELRSLLPHATGAQAEAAPTTLQATDLLEEMTQ